MNLHIAGHKINGWWIAGGGAGVLAIWYLYKRSASSATAGDTSSSAIDPATGLPYSEDSTVDPLTGLTYLTEAQEYGSVSAAEAAVSSGSQFATAEGTGNGAIDSGFPTITSDGGGTTGTSYATNAQWSQAVTAGLVSLGYSATDVAAALGLYFQSMPLGAGSDGVSYASIVQAAVAEFGPPPVGTFNIVTQPSSGGSTGTGTGGTGTGTGGTGTTPPPKTTPAPTPPAPTSYSDTPYTTYVDLGWGAAKGATEYHVQVLQGSTVVYNNTDVPGLNIRVSGLKEKTTYQWRVSAINGGAWTPFKSFTTKS